MNGEMEHAGGCVCGAVRFKATGEPRRVTVCHCLWCQRRTGTAFGVEAVFDQAQVEILGDAVARYRHVSDESGRWLDIEFCGRCGSNLGFTLEAVPGVRTLPAGAFDDPRWITTERHQFRHVYTRSRRDCGSRTASCPEAARRLVISIGRFSSRRNRTALHTAGSGKRFSSRSIDAASCRQARTSLAWSDG